MSIVTFIYNSKYIKATRFKKIIIIAITKNGAYKYEDGSRYVGDWNGKGLRHGQGSLLFPDGSRYDGWFQNGLFSKLGVFIFPDGAK